MCDYTRLEAQSSVLSTLIDDPEAPTEFQRSSDHEKVVEADNDTPAPAPSRFAYETINFSRLKGFHIPLNHPKELTSWFWGHGVPLEHQDTGTERWFLCLQCHQNGNVRNKHKWNIQNGSSNVTNHLRDVHRVTKDGELPTKKRKLSIIDQLQLTATQPREQAIINKLTQNYDHHYFKALLVRWVVHDNIAFHKIESRRFRDLIIYLNPSTENSLPTDKTLKAWLIQAFKLGKDDVLRQLQRSIGKVTMSFDLWSSRNMLVLLGICVHFLDMDGRYQSFLLALPEQEGTHTGVNIAANIMEIIREFRLQDQIGWFVCDNASNNETCLEELGSILGFDWKQRRLRCMGHIINLIARQILFGDDPDAFETGVEMAQDPKMELLLWRRQGPVGKLHNIVIWISRSSQRVQRFLKLQTLYSDDLALHLVVDVTTRWNSSLDMIERGVKLRVAIDSFIDEEQRKYDEYIARLTDNGRKPIPKRYKPRPSILDDRISREDWEVLTEYMAILAPFKEVTKELEGQPYHGNRGSIWEVLPSMEYLLEHLEAMKERYEYHPDIHFRTNINLGWSKIDEYYNRTKESPAYVASLVLHPQYKWQWIEAEWKEFSCWIIEAKEMVAGLWKDYKGMAVEETTERVPQSRRELSGFRARLQSHQHTPIVEEQEDEYDSWTSREPPNPAVSNPISYWIENRRRWPRLARMALDIFSIPAMSSDPERIFSLSGDMVSPKRNALQAETIGAAQCLKSWDKNRIFDISKAFHPKGGSDMEVGA
jgi:hypothetical protein